MSFFAGVQVKKPRGMWDAVVEPTKTTNLNGVLGGAAGEFDWFDKFEEEKLDTDDLGFGTTTETKKRKGSSSAPVVVKHPEPIVTSKEYASDAEVRHLNFLAHYGIKLTSADEVNLDDTSCEEEEAEDAKRRQCRVCSAARFEEDSVPTHACTKRLPDDVSVSSTSTSSSSYNPLKGSGQLADKSDLCDDRLAEEDDDSEDDDLIGSSQAEEDSESLVHGGGASAGASEKTRRAVVSAPAVACTCAKTGGHGSMGRMNSCFLCRWGNRRSDAVENNHMRTLMSMLDRHIGDIAPPFIALVMHAYYTKVMRREAAALGRILPVWRSKQILICITTHNYRPDIRLMRNIDTLTTLEQALERTMYTKDADGNITPSLGVSKRLLEVMKLKFALYGLNLTKMNFTGGENNPRYSSLQMVAKKQKSISALPGPRNDDL